MRKEDKLLNILCFDLMDTLIIPPSQECIKKWIQSTKIKFNKKVEQLFYNGYPFAIFIELSELSFEEQKNILLTREITNWEYFYKCLKIKSKNKINETITEEFITFFVENSKLAENVENLIIYLKARCSIGVVSNLYTSYKLLIEKFKLNELMDFIVLSCECGIRKPNRNIFKYVNEYKYKNKFFVGDNWISDIIAANDNGFTAIFFNKKDIFFNYLLDNGCAFLLENKAGKIIVKEKYKENIRKYIPYIKDIKNISCDYDISIHNNSKVIINKMGKIKKINKLIELIELIE